MKDEVQFSIYKLNKNLICEKNDNIPDNTDTNTMLEILVDNIDKSINNNRKGDWCKSTSNDDFTSLLIYTKREPIWKKLISNLMELNEDENNKITNYSISFILFHIVNDEIYAMTGGNGNFYLNEIKERNYGRDLIPRITKIEDSVIKSIKENKVSGKDTSSTRNLKNPSSVRDEKKYSSIPQSLQLLVDNSILEIFGLDDTKNKKVGVESGDQFKIKKSINLEELKEILIVINELEKLEPNYALSNLISIRNTIKKSDLDNELYNLLIKDPYIVEIEPDFDEKLITESILFSISYNGNIIESEHLIKMNDVLILLESEKPKTGITPAYLKRFFEGCNFIGVDESNRLTINTKLYNVLRGNIDFNNYSCYLLNGQWLMYDQNRYESIKKDYEDLYEKIENEINKLKIITKFNLVSNTIKDETSYNTSFKDSKTIIYAHTKNYKNIEFADLIFWDDDNLYLMCNKGTMNGQGVRDLLSQINTSSEILRGILDHDTKERKTLREYYNKLETTIVTEDEFVALFDKRIYYIAGFLNNYKKNTRSVHCQNLMKETSVFLKQKEMEFLAMNYLQDNSK